MRVPDDMARQVVDDEIEPNVDGVKRLALDLLDARRERDAAREEANWLRGIYGDILSRAEALGWHRPTLALDNFQSVLSWMADNAELARDAAREEAALAFAAWLSEARSLRERLKDAMKERDEARAECDDLHRTIDVLRDECAQLRVIEQAALYVLNAQDEGDLLDAERRVVEAFRSDATKPTKETL